MPDGRFVSRSISQNEQLADVSLEADFLFQRCIPHLDSAGRMSGNPELVRSLAVPLRREFTVEKVTACLTELGAAIGSDGLALVHLYEVNGRRVLEFPGFSRHQKGMRKSREAGSRHPPPPPNSGNDGGVTPATLPDLLHQDGGVHPPKLSEVKLSEVKPVALQKASSSSSSAREALSARLESDGDRQMLDRILAAVGESEAWVAEISVAFDGMHGPALTAGEIGKALRGYVGDGFVTDPKARPPSLKHFRAFLRDAKDRAPPTTGARDRPPRAERPAPEYASKLTFG